MTFVCKQHNEKNQLEIFDLTAYRSDLALFSPVNFSLKSGQSIQIRGNNGSGKTTLLRAVCGLTNHHDGQVCWNGTSISNSQALYHHELLYLGHSLGLKPKLTAEQNLNFFRELRFDANPQLIKKALQAFDIGDYFDEVIARMSAGQKRRVALARILTEPVALWILDEPMVALDVDGQQWLENVCNQHLENGGILLITSHQPIKGIIGLKELNLS